MKFHFMSREIDSANDLEKMCNELDQYGFYSVLLTYHSNQPDWLIKSLIAANNKNKIKFMLAIRTYAISPEYMAMICASYNLYYPEKLILNIASGDIKNDESSIDNIVFFKNSLDTPQKRLPYTNEWTEKFLKISNKWYTPEIIMSGHSEYTKKMVKKFDATHLSMMDEYVSSIVYDHNATRNKKNMVSLSIVIRNSHEEAFEFVKDSSPANINNAIKWTFFGTRNDIYRKIVDLQNKGVTDILFVPYENDENIIEVFEFIKNFNSISDIIN